MDVHIFAFQILYSDPSAVGSGSLGMTSCVRGTDTLSHQPYPGVLSTGWVTEPRRYNHKAFSFEQPEPQVQKIEQLAFRLGSPQSPDAGVLTWIFFHRGCHLQIQPGFVGQNSEIRGSHPSSAPTHCVVSLLCGRHRTCSRVAKNPEWDSKLKLFTWGLLIVSDGLSSLVMAGFATVVKIRKWFTQNQVKNELVSLSEIWENSSNSCFFFLCKTKS